MAMIVTENGALQSLGSTKMNEYPIRGIEVYQRFDGGRKSAPKNWYGAKYQFGKDKDGVPGAMNFNGSFGVDASSLIGGHDYYGGYDNATGDIDVSNDPQLHILSQAIDQAKGVVEGYREDLNEYTEKLKAAQKEYNYWAREEGYREGKKQSCCWTCGACKKTEEKRRLNAKSKKDGYANEVNKYKGLIDEVTPKLTAAQKTLDDSVTAHSDKIVQLEKEATRKQEIEAEKAKIEAEKDQIAATQVIEQLKSKVASEQIAAGKDPNLIAASLKKDKQKQQTTMIIAAASIVAIIVIAKIM